MLWTVDCALLVLLHRKVCERYCNKHRMFAILCRTMSTLSLNKLTKRPPSENIKKPKRKIDRFDGLSEEEVQKYTLSDYLAENLDLVVIGINPSLMAAHRGRYYAGPGNHFYKLLHVSGLVPRYVSFEEDYKLVQYGIGLTNIVARATRSSADLKKTEIKEGAKIVAEKLKRFKPKIAVFNGKCIYEVYANKTSNFNFGLQPEKIGDTAVWVIPSSSARCSNFPRMEDKLHFYTGLKKYLAFLKGEIDTVDVQEFRYEGKCKPSIPSTSKMWRRKNVSAFLHGGRIANRDTVCMDTSEENVEFAHSTEFIVTQILSKGDKDNPSIKGDIEEIKSLEIPQSQESAPGSSEDNGLSQQSNSDTVESLPSSQTNSSSIETNDKTDLLTCSTLASKLKQNNQRRKIIKRLPAKPIKPVILRHNNEGNGSPDFMSLIKERLQKKASIASNAETTGSDKKLLKANSAKAKLKKYDAEEEDISDS